MRALCHLISGLAVAAGSAYAVNEILGNFRQVVVNYLRDILHTFSELTGLNMVIDPDVHGSVTVRLHDVPWDQALDLILRTNGCGYVIEGNILRVGKPSNL